MRYLRYLPQHFSLIHKTAPKLSNLLTPVLLDHNRTLTSTAEQQQQPPRPPPPERVTAIVDDLCDLTLLEVMDLNEVLRQKLQVGEMPTMGVMMPGMGFGGFAGGAAGKAKGAGAAVEEKAEKTVFDVKLEGFDAAAKIKVIKEVRTFTDLGLKEAKDLVEKVPTVLKRGVTKEEAEKIIGKLKEIGAKVSME